MKCLKSVQKLWGLEEWLVNEKEYCAKYLWINPGYTCSLHYHKLKKETFIVVSGAVEIDIYDTVADVDSRDTMPITHRIQEGGSITLKPYTPHRFRAVPYRNGKYATSVEIVGAACVLEVSTHHDDNDVVRLVDSAELREPSDPVVTRQISNV